MDREAWLNGWPRMGLTGVLIGTQVRCVGCGSDRGTTTVVLDEDEKWPEKEPAWPFYSEHCPVCALTQQAPERDQRDLLTERLERLKIKRSV